MHNVQQSSYIFVLESSLLAGVMNVGKQSRVKLLHFVSMIELVETDQGHQ